MSSTIIWVNRALESRFFALETSLSLVNKSTELPDYWILTRRTFESAGCLQVPKVPRSSATAIPVPIENDFFKEKFSLKTRMNLLVSSFFCRAGLCYRMRRSVCTRTVAESIASIECSALIQDFWIRMQRTHCSVRSALTARCADCIHCILARSHSPPEVTFQRTNNVKHGQIGLLSKIERIFWSLNSRLNFPDCSDSAAIVEFNEDLKICERRFEK